MVMIVIKERQGSAVVLQLGWDGLCGGAASPKPWLAQPCRNRVCLLAGHLAGHMEDSRTPACLAPTY